MRGPSSPSVVPCRQRRTRGTRRTAVAPGREINVIGRVIEKYAQRFGYGEVRDFTGKDADKALAELLEREFAKPSYRPRTIMMGGVTDIYQPIERGYGVTRSLLEVMERWRHPVSLITKSQLVMRDIDILERLADLIRPAFAWREGGPGEKPAGAIEGSGFIVSPAMTSLTGASGGASLWWLGM